jgi:DNA-binding transcriptional MerR regulator
VANLMPIGRFSKVCRLSIKALRLYDELGLLRPELVDPETGYRYYSPAQANIAQAIALLRSVDMPLAEIRALLQAGDATPVQTLLNEHRARLARRLAENQRMLAFVERLIEGGAAMPYEVNLKEIPAQPVLAVRVESTSNRVGRDLSEAFGEIEREGHRLGVDLSGPPMIAYEDWTEARVHVQACMPVAPRLTVVDAGRVSAGELPGGLVAYTIHTGPYDEIGPAHEAIAAWIQQHGHEPTGPAREIYLTSSAEVQDPAKYQTEVVQPIR